MRRWFPLLFAILLVLVPAATANAATATTPTGDFVVGGGATVDFTIPPGIPFPIRYQNIVMDAHSDPSGANAGGTVSLEVAELVGSVHSVLAYVSGPVTCLTVSGNDALIGFDAVSNGIPLGPSAIHVIDNGASGSPPDEFFADPVSTTCGETPAGLHGGALVSGDLVVHDAVVPTSISQCFRGGWQQFVDNTGKPFGNQGACVAFVATHTRP
jgi:hypothetical protein